MTVSSPFDHLTVTPQEVFYAAMKGYELGENALRSMLLSSVGQLALRNDFFQLSRKEQDQLFGMIEAYVSEYRNQINPQTSATILPFRRK